MVSARRNLGIKTCLAAAIPTNLREKKLGMHRILFLPDIRLIPKPDTGYPAGYLSWQIYF
jgi:hypothetical protein